MYIERENEKKLEKMTSKRQHKARYNPPGQGYRRGASVQVPYTRIAIRLEGLQDVLQASELGINNNRQWVITVQWDHAAW